MKDIKQTVSNYICMAGVIAIFVMMAVCGWNTGDEMAVKKAKTAIPAEEASWTESMSPWQTEFRKNFKVME